MLRLKLKTDPVWVKKAVEDNIREILTDHAYCEQKAASSAISLIILYPDKTELVNEMTALAREEMDHFDQVHQFIQKRGFKLGSPRKDNYVGELYKFIRKGHRPHLLLLDRLLCAAMVEARSCERFKVISDHISDTEIADFYRGLMESEARHYATFLRLAKKYVDPKTVDQRWEEWLEYEGKVITSYGEKEEIHG